MNRNWLMIAACVVFLIGAAAGFLVRPWLYSDPSQPLLREEVGAQTNELKEKAKRDALNEQAIRNAKQVAESYMDLVKQGGAYSEAGKVCMTEQYKKSCPNYFPFVKPDWALTKTRLSPNSEIVWVDGTFSGIKALDGGKDYKVDFTLTFLREKGEKWLISSFTMEREYR